jgi:transposase
LLHLGIFELDVCVVSHWGGTGQSRGTSDSRRSLWRYWVSDDYGAYKSLFEQQQLCWAHLLRKAIKLRLENPNQVEYQVFLAQRCEIDQQAVRMQKDRRLSVGWAKRVEQLQAKIIELCTRAGEKVKPEQMPTHEVTFVRLQNEWVNGLDALFVFVAHPEVEPTNNCSERNVRREAEIRKGGRTSKSEAGADRRSILMTVLATLNTRFEKFTLAHLLKEVQGWIEQGCSIFRLELAAMTQANPPPWSKQLSHHGKTQSSHNLWIIHLKL